MFPFYTPENTLVFSGGIKWEHWSEIGQLFFLAGLNNLKYVNII